MYAGDKVILRALEKKDIPYIYDYINDYSTYSSFTDSPVTPKSTESVEKWTDYDNPSIITFAVDDKDEGRFIGTCQLRDIDRLSGRCWLSILIGDKNSRGKGYGRDIMKLLLNYAFMELNMYKVSLRVYSDNPSAYSLYEKTGFTREGILKKEIYRKGKYMDQIQYSILKDMWMEKTSSGEGTAVENPPAEERISGSNTPPLMNNSESEAVPHDRKGADSFQYGAAVPSVSVLPVTSGDIGNLTEIYEDPEVYSFAEMNTGFPSDPSAFFSTETRRGFKKMFFMIKDEKRHDLIGFIAADIILKDRKANLTVFLRNRNSPDFISVSNALLIKTGKLFFSYLRITKISVSVSEDDILIDGLESSGFLPEVREKNHIFRDGRFRDTLIYSLTDEENRK